MRIRIRNTGIQTSMKRVAQIYSVACLQCSVSVVGSPDFYLILTIQTGGGGWGVKRGSQQWDPQWSFEILQLVLGGGGGLFRDSAAGE